MKRIVIDIFEDTDGHKQDLVQIKSDDMALFYCDAHGWHGLQCSFVGDTKEYNTIQDIVALISCSARQLYKLCI